MPASPQVSAYRILVWINGQETGIPAGQSLPELLEFLSIPVDRVAVEIDKRIVRKRDWQQTLVPSGARIEIVEFVGGG